MEVRSNNRTTISALLSTAAPAPGIHKFADSGQRAVVPTPQTTKPPAPTPATTTPAPLTTSATAPTTPPNRATVPSRYARRFPTGAPISITGISLALEDDSRVRIEVSTTAKAAVYVHYQDGTRKLAMDIPNAFLKLTNPDDAEQPRTHPLLTALHATLAQDAPPMTRIALDTTRVVGFSVSAEANKLTLELRLPRSATGVLADKTIVVDAGHGGTSTGALGHGPNGITYEKNCTLAISLKLRDLLEAAGVRVVMARDKDVDVDLYDRPKLANNINADLFVSIHNDSNGVPNSTSGTTTYYHMNDPSSRALAACIQEQVVAVSGLPSHGARSDGTLYAHGLAVLRMTTMPAVLCEVAFINNSRDRACLTDPDFQQRVAQAIFNGLKNYVEGVQKTAIRLPTPQTTPAGIAALAAE